MSKLKKALEELGEETVGYLSYLIIEENKIATKELLNSLDYDVLETVDGFILNINAAEQLKYVDSGRRPNSKMPPIKPIESWIKVKGIQGRDKKGRYIKRKSLAFVIARSIGKKGIKPTHILKKTRQNILKNIDLITPAFKEELEEMIEKIFKQ